MRDVGYKRLLGEFLFSKIVQGDGEDAQWGFETLGIWAAFKANGGVAVGYCGVVRCDDAKCGAMARLCREALWRLQGQCG